MGKSRGFVGLVALMLAGVAHAQVDCVKLSNDVVKEGEAMIIQLGAKQSKELLIQRPVSTKPEMNMKVATAIQYLLAREVGLTSESADYLAYGYCLGLVDATARRMPATPSRSY